MINNKWFTENDKMWPGIALSLKIKKTLYEKNSKYQNILIFESETFGKVLVLDGIIQITERDESNYQEMLSHIPLFLHKNPKNLLIIGGGDLGITREVLKHNSIKKVTLCEIDKLVIEASKKYLPNISKEWNNNKVTIIIGDGSEYIKQSSKKF